MHGETLKLIDAQQAIEIVFSWTQRVYYASWNEAR